MNFDFSFDEINKTTYISIRLGLPFLAIKIPRHAFQKIKNNERIFNQINKPGVYLLLGSPFSKKVYVGESNNIFGRLQQHLHSKEKLFWKKVVIFGSSNNEITQTDAKYLEHCLTSAIKKTDYILLNKYSSSNIHLEENQKRKLEEVFLNNIKIILFDMGWSIDPVEKIEIENLFYISSADAKASGRFFPDSNKFEVLTGSILRNKNLPSQTKGKIALRKELLNDKVIELQNNKLLFIEDYMFESPSAAATVVLGHSASGPQEWKDENEVSLKENEN